MSALRRRLGAFVGSRPARLVIAMGALTMLLAVAPAGAQSSPTTTPAAPATTAKPPASSGGTAKAPNAPATPSAPTTAAGNDKPAQITVDLNGTKATGDGAGPLQVILLITLIAFVPAILILVTAFTRVVIVLGLTRNALSLQGVPPNQVLIGLALFLTVFVMAPVFTEANNNALQPYLKNEITQSQAIDAGVKPFREFMTKQVRQKDLALMVVLSNQPAPATPDDVPLTTLIPAFVIGELRAAFLIGFIIFIPFVIIDMVTSATLMSMGMVMVPPSTVALPFKLLLFVLVDGWQLLVGSLVKSFVT